MYIERYEIRAFSNSRVIYIDHNGLIKTVKRVGRYHCWYDNLEAAQALAEIYGLNQIKVLTEWIRNLEQAMTDVRNGQGYDIKIGSVKSTTTKTKLR